MTDLARDERIARARRLVREYDVADGLGRPAPKRRAASGKIVAYLEATGWTRSPAEFCDDCGAETEISICHHPARWIKDGVDLCAQHAYSAERRARRAS